MPVLDMPLEESQKYHGISPKPAAFDAYWERGLRELASVEPELTITEKLAVTGNRILVDELEDGAIILVQ